MDNKTALITGASGGLGKELVLKYLHSGYKVIAVSRNVDKLKENFGNYKNCSIYGCDVASREMTLATNNMIMEIEGLPDIIILNAAVAEPNTLDSFDYNKIQEVINTNLFGVINFIDFYLPHFIEQKKGTIVGIGSLADKKGFSGAGFYTAGKAALSNWFEGLQAEGSKFNVKFILVKPGFIKTEMTKKMKIPDVLFINPAKAAEIIFNGIKNDRKNIIFPKYQNFLMGIIRHLPLRMLK